MRYLLAAAFLLLTGCVTVQPVVQSAAAPQSNEGYVAGVFSASGADDYGLGITNINGGDEVVLPFADLATSKIGANSQDRVTMIQLPTGRYRISSWLTFGRFSKERITRKELPAGADSLAFDVAPGRVRYLGKFAAETSFGGFSVYFKVRPQRIAQKDLALLLEIAYPNFRMDMFDPQPGSVY
jgi:hypothetical protein